jgi:hypothetical protein
MLFNIDNLTYTCSVNPRFRQKTPFDDVCVQADKDGQPCGARLFGDCDRLMREVMKCVLPAIELRDWEAGRNDRLVGYAASRAGH